MALRIANLVLGLVNLVLFGFWLSLSHVSAVDPTKGQFDFNFVSFQITILAAVVGVMGIGLTALGFLGYSAVVQSAEAKADKTARDTAREVVSSLHRGGKLVPGSSGTLAANALPTATAIGTDTAQLEEGA